jgi:hypothetical protein
MYTTQSIQTAQFQTMFLNQKITTCAYYIDHKAKIKYDKPNMRFDIECHDGTTKAK